jgi:hypothetical protein
MDVRFATGRQTPDAAVDGSNRLRVYVVATTCQGTQCALLAAQRLAAGLGARIIILVPHVVSYVVPVDSPSEDPTVLIDEYRALAATAGVEASVRLCLCRRPIDVFKTLLSDRSTIVLGGHRGRWWPSAAQRMAHQLRREGYDLVFVEVERS